MKDLKAEKLECQNQHPPQPQEPSELGTTFFRICVNGLNTLSGVGILSIPFALFHEVGNSTSAVRRIKLCLPPTFIPARYGDPSAPVVTKYGFQPGRRCSPKFERPAYRYKLVYICSAIVAMRFFPHSAIP
ncbi:unnamed protein product [Prunus armeniaca]